MSRSSGATADNVTVTVTSDEVVETRLVAGAQPGVEVIKTGVETPNAGTRATGAGGTPPTAKNFLSRVVPWPVNGIGYINLHYSRINAHGGKNIVTGKPYQDIDQFLSFCN